MDTETPYKFIGAAIGIRRFKRRLGIRRKIGILQSGQ